MTQFSAVKLHLEQHSAGPNGAAIWLRLDGGHNHTLTEQARQSLYASVAANAQGFPTGTVIQVGPNAGILSCTWSFPDAPVNKQTSDTRAQAVATAAKTIGDAWAKVNISPAYPPLVLTGAYGKSL